MARGDLDDAEVLLLRVVRDASALDVGFLRRGVLVTRLAAAIVTGVVSDECEETKRLLVAFFFPVCFFPRGILVRLITTAVLVTPDLSTPAARVNYHACATLIEAH